MWCAFYLEYLYLLDVSIYHTNCFEFYTHTYIEMNDEDDDDDANAYIFPPTSPNISNIRVFYYLLWGVVSSYTWLALEKSEQKLFFSYRLYITAHCKSSCWPLFNNFSNFFFFFSPIFLYILHMHIQASSYQNRIYMRRKNFFFGRWWWWWRWYLGAMCSCTLDC